MMSVTYELRAVLVTTVVVAVLCATAVNASAATDVRRVATIENSASASMYSEPVFEVDYRV